jgi:diacylglycerol kinase (ATP)
MKSKNEKICFIYNPSAGRGIAGEHLESLRNRADELWSDAQFMITQKESDISEFAGKAAKEFDLIVGCGGDGTINQVINGIAGSDASLGVIPLGSGNDFANAVGLPADPMENLKLIHRGKTRPLDLIRCDGDIDTWCANTLGIGLDGWANYYAAGVKKVRGQMIYIIGILKAVYAYRGSMMQITIDGMEESRELLMVTVCNGPEEGGGFKVAPDASNSDGYIDLLILEKMPVARVLWYLPKFLIQPRKKLKGVNRIRCKKVNLITETPLAVHCDGQGLGTDISSLSATIKPGVLNVIVP